MVSAGRDPRQDEVDQEWWALCGNEDHTADLLMEAIDSGADPQRVEDIFRDLMDDVVKIERHDGWFDLVGLVKDSPFLVIRYQWWPTGWHYRIVNPKWDKDYRLML